MCSRRKAEADAVWKYADVPPSALIKSLDLKPASVDQDEFARARWFWSRRPKALWESLGFFFFYVTVVACLLYLIPDSIWFLVLWILAGASWVAIDGVLLDRWRSEYESSIKRMVVRLSERK
jgi:hypothetical protein